MAQVINFNLKPVNFNPVVDDNSDTEYVLKLTDPNGDPCPLTGYTAKMQMRPYPGASTLYDELTTENQRLVINGNELKVKFPASVSKNYSFHRAVYDILVMYSGSQWRIAQGAIEFDKGVTA